MEPSSTAAMGRTAMVQRLIDAYSGVLKLTNGSTQVSCTSNQDQANELIAPGANLKK